MGHPIALRAICLWRWGRRLVPGAEARVGLGVDVRAEARTYLRGNGKGSGKDEMRGFFPFGSAQGQNEGLFWLGVEEGDSLRELQT